jgi:2-amino-4-hydroxy-6-hydroxymethyldihydropteridine diphosphokinase
VSSTVVIALGSNLGNREWYIRAAIEELRRVFHVVRISGVRETEPVAAPPPRYLNCVVAGYTSLTPEDLLRELQTIETRLGRRRRFRNAPRTIDLDLILHSANRRRSPSLTIPHPRYREREFVLAPMRELGLEIFTP